WSANTVSVLLNTTAGAAALSFAAQQTFPTGTAPYAVVAADVNGDNQPDVITADAQSASASVLLNLPVASATALTSSVNPSAAGQAVGLTAKVSSVLSQNFFATGTVTFKDGATVLGTATLANGTATF